MSLLALGLAVAALAFMARRSAGRRASLGALLMVYGAPALFLAFVLVTSRDDATRFRFALLGLGFRGEAGKAFQVPIGGDRERDGVWISALAEARPGTSTKLGSLVFQPPEQEDAGTVTFAPSPDASAGLLGIRADGSLRPLSALELADDDRLTVAGRVWEVELDTGWLGPPAALVSTGDLRVDLPARVGRLPLGVGLRILRPLPAVFETYSLAWLAREAEGEAVDGTPGFLFWEPRGLFGRRLWLAPTDASVTVERAGAAVEAATASPLAAVHVLSPPRWNGAGFAAGGVRDRRSFRLLPGRRGFALMYDTPEVHVLSRAALEALALAPAHADSVRLPTVRFNLAMGGWQVTDESLYFRHASRRVALQALASLELPHGVLEGSSRRTEIVAATPRGQRRGRLGEPLWLGGDNLAAVQVDVLEPPLGLALLALVLAALKALAARAGRLSVVHLGFAAPLEALVAVRLLLGYRVWAMPPFDQEALELALAAWALLPWSLIVAAAGAERFADEPRGRFLGVLPALGGALFALAWCWTLGGGGVRRWVWVACLAAAAGVWAARAAGGPERLAALASRWTSKERGERRVLTLWTVAAFVPSLARLGLLLLGNRESLLVGNQRFALSLVHVPVALLLEAACLVWLWRRMEARRALVAVDLVPALALLVGTWLLPGLIANDLGLALLNVPVFLLALASLTLAARRRLADDGLDAGRLHLLPAAVLGVYLAFVAFPLGARALLAVVPQETELALESERNYLRLLAFAYPARLEQVARRSSEELAVMSAVMRRYTSGPFAGRGYFGSELSPHIRATALREHAPAVFVAAEWGLAGILGLLLVYGALGAAGRAGPLGRTLDEPSAPAAFWGAASDLAALTLAVPSVYMLLANYRLTLFTGKNVYLLGLDSTADVLEVLLLTLLFAFGASVVGEEE